MAIDVLAQPSIHPADTVQRAQDYCDNFKSQGTERLSELIALFFSPELVGKQQHQFWILSTVAQAMHQNIRQRCANEPAVGIDVAKCFMQLT